MKKRILVSLLYFLGSAAFSQSIERQTATGYVNISKDPPKPSNIEIVKSSVFFSDLDKNNTIDANESCKIFFDIKNFGIGEGMDLLLVVEDKNKTGDINFTTEYKLGNLAPDSSRRIEIPIHSGMNTVNGNVLFSFNIKELNGFDSDPFMMEVPVRAFIKPQVKIVDYKIISQSGRRIVKKQPFMIQALLQNIGQGKADSVVITLNVPDNMFCLTNNTKVKFDELSPGESQTIEYNLVANNNYNLQEIKLDIDVSEKYNKYSENKSIDIVLNQNVTQEKLSITSIGIQQKKIETVSLSSSVDKNIPENSKKYPSRIALIIGNEDYSGNLNEQVNVDYAVNDAVMFREYALRTLGIDEKNIILLTNATTGQMRKEIDRIGNLSSKLGSESEIIFYYAGHGFPDEVARIPYLIPVDVDATNLSAAIKLADVYNTLGNSGARKVTIFMDACFTGGARNQGLFAARGVRVKPKEDLIPGNSVVFSASSGDQAALPYHKEKHGMFTYFLLQKLQESQGKLTYADLADYLKRNVSIEAIRVNSKNQDPETNASQTLNDSWKNWKIND